MWTSKKTLKTDQGKLHLRDDPVSKLVLTLNLHLQVSVEHRLSVDWPVVVTSLLLPVNNMVSIIATSCGKHLLSHVSE